MKTNRITKRASGLCLALMVGFIVLAMSTVGFGQTYSQETCFTLATSSNQTSTCGSQTSECEAGSCDHCLTIDMTNVSQNCDITQITITCTDASICFSTCCPAIFGSPDITACSTGPKTYTGHFGPTPLMPSPGIARFTICYKGTGTHTFQIQETGSAAWGAGNADCCSTMTHASVNF